MNTKMQEIKIKMQQEQDASAKLAQDLQKQKAQIAADQEKQRIAFNNRIQRMNDEVAQTKNQMEQAAREQHEEHEALKREMEKQARIDDMCKRMENKTRNPTGIQLSDIKCELFELVRKGHNITHIKEYSPFSKADVFSFGITAVRTTYVSYWDGHRKIGELKAFGSSKPKDEDVPDKTWSV